MDFLKGIWSICENEIQNDISCVRKVLSCYLRNKNTHRWERYLFSYKYKKKIEMINPFQVISICKLICLHKNIHTVTPNVPLYSAKINKKKKKKKKSTIKESTFLKQQNIDFFHFGRFYVVSGCKVIQNIVEDCTTLLASSCFGVEIGFMLL